MPPTLPYPDTHRLGQARHEGKGSKNYRPARSYTKAFPDSFATGSVKQNVSKPDAASGTSSMGSESPYLGDSDDEGPMKEMLWEAFLDSYIKIKGQPKSERQGKRAREGRGALADAAESRVGGESCQELYGTKSSVLETGDSSRGHDREFQKSNSTISAPRNAQSPTACADDVEYLEDDSEDTDSDDDLQNVHTFPPTPPNWLWISEKEIWRVRQQRINQIQAIMDANRKPGTGRVDTVGALAAWNSTHGWKPDYQKYEKYLTLCSRLSQDKNLLRGLMKKPRGI